MLRVLALHEIHQGLAHLAAQVPVQAGVIGRDQNAQLHALLPRLDHLQQAKPLIPLCSRLTRTFGSLAQGLKRHAVVHPQTHRADDAGTFARPILKRGFYEPLQRDDEPALVPDLEHDVGTGDLLHPAPLTLHDQHIV